jgi:hypothetical protein
MRLGYLWTTGPMLFYGQENVYKYWVTVKYNLFQKALYNFERLSKFIQKIFTYVSVLNCHNVAKYITFYLG